MIFGQPESIDDPAHKRDRLNGLIDSLYPGRSALLRPITDSELARTAVLSLRIDEASAKVRAQGPVDDEADYELPIWAGTIPVRLQIMAPEPDPRNVDGVDIPDHVVGLRLD